MDGARSRPALRKLLVPLAAAFAVTAFLVHEVYSLDVWWQVAIGREILATLSVPTVDRFSILGAGQPYHDSHWLFQVLLAAAHRVGGWTGVQTIVVGLWGLALAFCYRSCRLWVPSAAAAVLSFLAAMASVERFLPRPEVVTFAALSFFYLRLQRGRYRSGGDLALLVVVQALWANSHGLFVLGPFLVSCYWGWALVQRVRGRPSELVALSRAIAAVTAASLLTPLGLGGWRYAAVLLREAAGGGPAVMRDLGELSATFGPGARSAPAFWFFLVLLAVSALAVLRALRRRRVSPRLVIVGALAAAALTGRRNVVLFALVAAPFLAETLADLTPVGRKLPRWAPAGLAALMVAWAVYPLSGAYYLSQEIPARFGLGVTPSFFPHDLPGFLDRIGFQGRVLNSNTLGGFVLFHGYPERLPLTDGRWEVYEVDRLQRALAQSRGPGWRRLVAEHGLRSILLAHTSPEARALLPELAVAPDWRLVYYDRAASFWLPDSTPSPPPAVDPDDLARLPPLARPEDGLILEAFLSGVGAREARRANLERTLALGVRRSLLLERLGALQLESRRFREAEATYRTLLEIDPASTAALNELAFLAWRRGEVERARELLERALAVEPDNRKLVENYRRLSRATASGPRTPEGER